MTMPPTEVDMAAERRRLADAVQRACRRLGVECECPFGLSDGAGGTVEFAAYLADFGGPLGMVIDPTSPVGFAGGQACGEAASKAGLYLSTLGQGYPVEDEEEFLDALVDWGCFGSLETLSDALRRKRALRRSRHARP